MQIVDPNDTWIIPSNFSSFAAHFCFGLVVANPSLSPFVFRLLHYSPLILAGDFSSSHSMCSVTFFFSFRPAVWLFVITITMTNAISVKYCFFSFSLSLSLTEFIYGLYKRINTHTFSHFLSQSPTLFGLSHVVHIFPPFIPPMIPEQSVFHSFRFLAQCFCIINMYRNQQMYHTVTINIHAKTYVLLPTSGPGYERYSDVVFLSLTSFFVFVLIWFLSFDLIHCKASRRHGRNFITFEKIWWMWESVRRVIRMPIGIKRKRHGTDEKLVFNGLTGKKLTTKLIIDIGWDV